MMFLAKEKNVDITDFYFSFALIEKLNMTFTANVCRKRHA